MKVDNPERCQINYYLVLAREAKRIDAHIAGCIAAKKKLTAKIEELMENSFDIVDRAGSVFTALSPEGKRVALQERRECRKNES